MATEIKETLPKVYTKELCRLAGIDQVIKGNKMSSVTKRLTFGMYPKYELITSHTI